QPGPRECGQLRFGAGANVPHRFQDPATRRGDRLVVHPQRPTLLIVQTRGPEHGVSVAVDEPGEEHPSHLHLYDCGLRIADCRMEVAGFATRADPGDALAVDEHGGVAQDFELRHLPAAARARWAATGDDLTGADQQRPQSPASRIARRMACPRAAARAAPYARSASP